MSSTRQYRASLFSLPIIQGIPIAICVGLLPLQVTYVPPLKERHIKQTQADPSKIPRLDPHAHDQGFHLIHMNSS